jgi:hypothetical protein
MPQCLLFCYMADGTPFSQPLSSGCRRSSWCFWLSDGRFGVVAGRAPVRSCCKQAWLLKNSFRGITRMKFARKLLNLRLP